MSDSLVRRTQLDRDKTALANVETAGEAREIAERNAALYRALKGMKGYEEEYYKAFDNMIVGYWIIGNALSEMEMATGGQPYQNLTGTHTVPVECRVPTLADLDITKKQSSDWQTIALLPRTEIEDYIEAKRKADEYVAKADIIRLAQAHKSADQIAKEEMVKVINAMGTLCIVARHLTDHLTKFPDSRKVTTQDFFKLITTTKEIIDELERRTM